MRSNSLFLVLGAVSALGCGNGESTSGSGGTGTGGTTSSGGAGGTGGVAECPTDVKAEAGTVITTRGPVTGTKAGTTWAFKGIPYAAPPTGDLRWKRPVEHACWADALPAADFGPKCMQLDADSKVVGSEDCLSVNVWVPEDATPESPVPVLFFVHGGGNVQGASSVDVNGLAVYDGQSLAEKGHVAVVTINYRLGPFGFLAHPGFAEGDPASSGNYGMLDQVFALRWAKENLTAFGGDPSKVMLFGESAGGLNTCILLTSPLAEGLFSSALIESGGCVAEKKEDAEAFAADWAVKAGCDGAADPVKCMRDMAAEDVEALVPAPIDLAGKQGPYQPILDGYLLTGAPFDVLAAGDHNHVPVVMGSNENETGAAVPAMTEAEYTAAVTALFGALAPDVLAVYPVADYAAPRDAYVQLTSDGKFICPVRRTLRALSASQSEPVYRYQFTHVLDNVGPAQKAKGAFHGLELFFVFGQLGVAGYVASPGEEDLSAEMQGYWSRFGAAGEPGQGSSVTWPAFDPAKDSYLRLDTTISAEEGVHTEKCDFWDSLVP